ncbi:MAG: condensation domain-containing protein, partial [Candidatus Omnitrophota bacterium]
MTLTIENTTDDRLNTDIAVIGMSGRFPLAKNLEEFWENLKNGKDCIAKVPESRLSDLRAFSGNESVHFPDLGYLDDISRFDANFFGIPEEESPFIDPSQRLLLEVVYEAFESGGYGGSKMANTRTGVFIASSNSNYRLFFYRGDSSRLSEPGLIPAIGAGRISHVFDLRGPSLMIDTACSSTLAALHVACESLRRNECAMALVGAINIYALLGGNEEVSSSFNRCRVFDHLAGEIVGGEGMGAILLKPLHMALKDQDIIFAVIKGTAINQNGGRPPTVSGQSIEALCDVMQQAWDNARITPDTLSYIEASGAANPIGDVFEVKSITDAFAKYTNKKECCSIGSVKTNIGHLNHASGMASLLKVILAMNHKHVPPLIHLEKPNPYIDFQNSPVFIDTRLREWETIENRPMRAGVSSFSMSGTNCHAVIEAPPPRPYPAESYGEHSNIITISAKSKTSLAKLCQAIKDYISNNPHEDIHDICFTQNTGRGQYEYRLALVFKGKNRLIEHLTNASFLEDKANVNGGEIFFRTDVKRASREESSAVFLFSDCSAMPERIFRNFLGKGFLAEAYMNECLTILPMETSSRVLSFAFQYALARLWMDAGIRPAFVLGFGIGKYVSKVISGSMKLDEALSLCGSDNGKENTFNKDKVIENIQVMYAKKGQKVYLEIGPGNILGQITRQTLERYGDCHVLDSYGRDDDEKMLLESIARLYIGGIPIDFSSLFPGQRLVLPVYPFEGKRYWVNVRPAFLDGPSESGGRGKPAQLPETLPMALKPRPDINVAYTAPRTEIEQALSEIFRNFFHIETVGIYDDFFKLGGDSLKAVSLISLIHRALNVDVPLTEFFSNPNIQGLAEIIERMEKNIFVSIEPVEEREYYILSSAQKRLYVLQHMVVDNISYNMPSVIPLSENIEKEKLESVFKRLIQRHESLRTSFITIGEEPVQRIYDKVDFSIGWYETTEEEAERLISGFTRPFDLSVAPLLRVNHVGIGSSSRVLVIDMHHIITDGVSQEILGKEFDALYSGKGELSPLHLQYKDYAVWQNSEIQHTRIKEQENYWLNRFSDEIPVLELPTDYPRPVLQSFQGGTVEFGFSSEETAALKRLATELGVTPYMLILSVLTILLSRLSGQDDIVVGTAIAGRRHADLEQIIGMFVNTLALRYFPRGAMDYKEFIEELKSHTLGAYDHPDYPFEDLVDHLSVIRDIGRNPVFDVMYNFLSREDRVIKTDRGPVESNHRKGTSKFDLTLTALDYGDRLFFTFDYCTKLFVSKTIDRFISYFKRLMGQV